jgi:hypothetical protein
MAAILITDCTVTNLFTAGFKMVKIVTPATADDADTIDVSTLFSVGCMAICSGATDNSLLVAAPVYTDRSITIPGSTDNEARTIIAFGE